MGYVLTFIFLFMYSFEVVLDLTASKQASKRPAFIAKILLIMFLLSKNFFNTSKSMLLFIFF